jgi:hypothetical protein
MLQTMLQWLRLTLVPELRCVPPGERPPLMADAMLRALSDRQVHWAGSASSMCGALGAIFGGHLLTGVLTRDAVRFFSGLCTGTIIGGVIGGALYVIVLLARTRPHVRRALSMRRPTPAS